jgi:integrase
LQGIIFHLLWSDLLWDKNLIPVRGTKSKGSYRHVPLSDRVEQALRVRAQGAKGRFVFSAKRKKDAPLSYVAIAKRFTRLRAAAGIPDDLVLYS